MAKLDPDRSRALVEQDQIMRFVTDDGRFGVLLSPVRDHDARLFQFQLILDGTVVGDKEPCIPYTALRQMNELPRLDDVGLDSTEPAHVFAALRPTNLCATQP